MRLDREDRGGVWEEALMKFIDWFSGIGGFTRGMELAGHECVGHCEIDKYAEASYRSMHCITDVQREYLESLDIKKRREEILKEEYLNGEWYADDVSTVRGRDIPKSDCWCFGFPCQDISISGKKIGLDGDRSSLFFTIMGLLDEVPEENKPTYLFAENVRNLFSVNRGFDFARILVEMGKRGYSAEWRLLNSKHFGVPQNRERVFIIGRTGRASGREIFPVGDSEETLDELQRHPIITGTVHRINALQTGTYPIEGGGGIES